MANASLNPQASFPISNGLAPGERTVTGDIGPRAVVFNFSVSATTPATFDLQREIANGEIDNPQAVFIDNSANSSPATFLSSELGLPITIAANSQGFFPAFGKTLSSCTVSTTNASAAPVNIAILNTPMPFAVWKSV
jgi:hypothetical protein